MGGNESESISNQSAPSTDTVRAVVLYLVAVVPSYLDVRTILARPKPNLLLAMTTLDTGLVCAFSFSKLLPLHSRSRSLVCFSKAYLVATGSTRQGYTGSGAMVLCCSWKTRTSPWCNSDGKSYSSSSKLHSFLLVTKQKSVMVEVKS
jgi:hypothetical protein